MNKKSLIIAGLCFVAVLVFAAEKKVSRFGQSVILNQGGSNTTSGSSVVVSDSATNEFRISIVSPAVTGSEAVATNIFVQPYAATPTIFQGVNNGAKFTTNIVITVTTSNLIVSGLSTNAVSSVPVLLYGYKNTGVFE